MPTKLGLLFAKLSRSGSVDARSLIVYKNVFQSVFIKGLSILIGFLTIPLTLTYISVDDFGIWMTITFLTSWFSLVDVSFGNGLRNSLVVFFNTGDTRTAQQYVSTLYFLSVGVALLLAIAFVVIGHYLNWTSLLNIRSDNPEQVNGIITYTLVSFSAQVVLKPIHSILLADQKAALAGWLLLLINALIIAIIYFGTGHLDKSLMLVAHIYNLVPLGVLGSASLYFFFVPYASIAPRYSQIDLSLSRELFSLGGQFFVLQLVSVLVFTSGGLFISYFLGSDKVTPYSIANKYFSVVTVLYGIVITPYWSAFTDAYVKQDTAWINHTLRQLNRISAGMAILAGLMLLAANAVFKVWIGPQVYVPTELSVSLMLYVISFIFLSNYNSFINGTGKVRVLVYASLIGVILYVALTTLLFRWIEAGPTSVVIAGTVWNIALLLVCVVEYRRIVQHMPPISASN
ncbi:lipopolysaccharide biosynthesis protein [Spirosoma utsteinense]|uniref:O-antigen/teichoic acid export membrane protein n=1 Tax=Spirosoma utsteinense TaxID=2585773 RepID=A0ABR6W7M4_9BACT|nr:oligosaccharide flippase family protein [Spirosoma utsteinense]MBC3783956.1 O-antigen/teichoic acid export membrane protein [Spirosoma utsteinense]MBC3792590.1 O-antigen/teichoic acid export membrane protein [Spirosoma utsteinense]